MNGNSCNANRHECSLNPCVPCEREHNFSRVVATWKTVRNYEVRFRDTLVPVCIDGLRDENLENCIAKDKC